VTYRLVIDASFQRVSAIIADKVERPRKYIASVIRSDILERGDGFVIRETRHQALLTGVPVTEKISTRAIVSGQETVCELVGDPNYVGTARDRLTRVHGRDDRVELEYDVMLTPRHGAAEPPLATLEAIVRDSAHRVKEFAENSVVVPAWVRQFFDALDGGEVDAMRPLLADDCRFRVGNFAEVIGREDVVSVNRTLVALSAKVDHHFINVDVHEGGNRAYVDSLAEYTTHDGKKFLLPFLTVFDRTQGKIARVLVYGDISPLRHGWPD
jgi:ketosteroid isomerase-like protein